MASATFPPIPPLPCPPLLLSSATQGAGGAPVTPALQLPLPLSHADPAAQHGQDGGWRGEALELPLPTGQQRQQQQQVGKERTGEGRGEEGRRREIPLSTEGRRQGERFLPDLGSLKKSLVSAPAVPSAHPTGDNGTWEPGCSHPCRASCCS